MLPDHYTLSNLKQALKRPSLLKQEMQTWLDIIYKPVNNYTFRLKYGDGEDVMKEEWDNLIILDACRYDVFSDRCEIDGSLSNFISCSSNSWGFMQENFVGKNLHDTIYITTNPYVEKLSDDVFFTVNNLLDRWDSDVGTVHPGEVVAAAINTHKQYPNKKLIIHFMQPHRPWIGETAAMIRRRLDLEGFNKNHVRSGQEDPRTGESGFSAVRDGIISDEEMKQAYNESVDIVLSHVDDLIEQLDGKSVVTADHGEMLGDRLGPGGQKHYGHGYKVSSDLSVLAPELHCVPWFEISDGESRQTSEDTPIGFDRLGEEVRKERLQDLGYLTE